MLGRILGCKAIQGLVVWLRADRTPIISDINARDLHFELSLYRTTQILPPKRRFELHTIVSTRVLELTPLTICRDAVYSVQHLQRRFRRKTDHLVDSLWQDPATTTLLTANALVRAVR